MPHPTRKAIVDAADTIVIKVGTRVLTHSTGALDQQRVASLAEQLAFCRAQGKRVVLVSSGAVGAGIGRLALDYRPVDLADLQAVASVGQSCLMEAYNRALETHGHHAAQVLLTVDDFNDRARYLNVHNTLFALFRLGAVPIVNENDVVRVDELQRNFGDNDRLAAMVTNLLRAPLLVLLSDVEGVYDLAGATPGEPPRVIPEIDLSLNTTADLVGELPAATGVQLSKGGMRSKLEAARMVTAAGERAIIASGRRDGVLRDLLAGEEVGTLVTAHGPAVSARKRWIGHAARCHGTLVLDDGAVRALTQQGSSLLAVGIARVEGSFVKGDAVSLVNSANKEVARGLTNYSSEDLRTIAGQSTARIAELLGHRPYEEVVHRDHLVLSNW